MLTRRRYDFIFSMGQACSCTECLRKAGLQTFSFPFDWIGENRLPERAEYVKNGFEGWFEKQDWQFLCDKPGHRFHVYLNRKTGFTYNHDFPLELDFEAGYPIVAAKYARRVARLDAELKSARRALAVFTEVPLQTDFTPDALLAEVPRTIAARYPDTVIDLLYIHRGESRRPVRRTISEHVTILSFDYKSRKPGALDYEVDRKLLAGAICRAAGLTLRAFCAHLRASIFGKKRT